MNQSALVKLFSIVVALLLSLWAIATALTDTLSGGIGTVVKFTMVGLLPVVFAKPKFGLYLLVIVLANIEWIKRLAVYFGVASPVTAIEMLVIPIILLGIIILGVLVSCAFGRTKMTTARFLMFAVSGIIILAILQIRGTDTLGIQAAINTGLYVSMIPVLLILIEDQDDFRKFMNFCVLMFLPSAMWAIKQYFLGLGDVEMHYVKSYISPVLSMEVLLHAQGNPRPFGLASSQASFGAIAFLAWYTIWHTIAVRKNRGWFILLAIIYFAALVCSGQRTILFIQFIALGAYILFRSKPLLILAYSMGLTLLGLGIIFSGALLDRLDEIQESITVQDGGWGEKTLRVATYSDRLRGWERLKNPEVWSLFGKKIEGDSGITSVSVDSVDYSHDMINNFLKTVGAAGLLPCIILLIFILYRLHKMILQLPKGSMEKNMAAGALAISVPNLVLSIMGGGNFNTTPVNFFTWTFFAMAFVAARSASAPVSRRQQAAEATGGIQQPA